jgi:NAD(P)-dependent dehydrogenase (short-subunit alcohol dehydrogenase family)
MRDIFAGGIAVITGAGGGLGEGFAKIAGGLGMKLVLADISATRLESAVAALRQNGVEALGVPTDVADPAAVVRLAAAAHEKFGPVRLLINNAGIETLGLSWEIPAEAWARTININLLGAINGARAFVPNMLAAGQQAYILNIASIASLSTMPVAAPYIVSKHAVLAFSECLKLELELQSAPIQVSAALPGPVATGIFQDPSQAGGSLAENHRKFMDDMLAAFGMTTEDAAQTILEQVSAGKFWVATHPDILTMVATSRADQLTHLKSPELTDQMRSMLPGSSPL